jgi:hypothetical protein
VRFRREIGVFCSSFRLFVVSSRRTAFERRFAEPTGETHSSRAKRPSGRSCGRL